MHAELIDKRSDFNTKYQYAYNIQDASNEEFSKHLKKLEDVVLPEYTEKIKDSRQKAYDKVMAENTDIPQIIMGAEVAFFAGISRAEKTDALIVVGTDIM